MQESGGAPAVVEASPPVVAAVPVAAVAPAAPAVVPPPVVPEVVEEVVVAPAAAAPADAAPAGSHKVRAAAINRFLRITEGGIMYYVVYSKQSPR